MSFLFDFVSPLRSDSAWESFKRLRNHLLFIYLFWRGRSGRETPQCVILFQPVCLSSVNWHISVGFCKRCPSHVIVCHHVSEDKVLCIWGLLSPWPVFIQMISSVKIVFFWGELEKSKGQEDLGWRCTLLKVTMVTTVCRIFQQGICGTR